MEKRSNSAHFRFSLVAAVKSDPEELRSLGTYGFIKNPAGFVVGIGEESEKYLEDFGYLMEKNILYATSLGVDSCWLGASFRKSNFEKRSRLQGHEELLAMAAIGYGSDTKSLFDRAARRTMNSASRKAWEELFYYGDFTDPLSEEQDRYRDPLEMVRLAPSAANAQPWRIVKDRNDEKYHFFLNRKRGYKTFWALQNREDLQRIDMGIAMCHFELTAKEKNLSGSWQIVRPTISLRWSSLEYTATWVC